MNQNFLIKLNFLKILVEVIRILVGIIFLVKFIRILIFTRIIILIRIPVISIRILVDFSRLILIKRKF